MKKRNKNITPKLPTSNYFSIPIADINVECQKSQLSFNGLRPFINTFIRHCRIRSFLVNQKQNLYKFIVFYISYYYLHSSRIIDALYNAPIYLSIPQIHTCSHVKNWYTGPIKK